MAGYKSRSPAYVKLAASMQTSTTGHPFIIVEEIWTSKVINPTNNNPTLV